MTEPVAYLNKYKDKSTNITRFKPIDNTALVSSNKLYTSEQLHPRVKMTQTEFDEWHKLFEEVADLYTAVIEICDFSHYPNLYFRFFDLHNDDTDKTRKTQMEFSTLWSIFDEFNPEETIEIIPDMKWFVRSKEKYEAEPIRGIPESGYLYLTDGGDDYGISYCEMTTFKDDATQFDTKEEAERWVNPLTEAVKLPVEV